MPHKEKLIGDFTNASSAWAGQRALRRLIEHTDGLIRESGPMAQSYLDHFYTTGCREEYRRNLYISYTNGFDAAYAQIDYQGRKTRFANSIVYPHGNIASTGDMVTKRLHEMAHAQQATTSAALHADLANYAKTGIALSPAALVLATIRAEQDAFARQAMITSLVCAAHPELRKDISGDFADDVARFESARARGYSFPTAFAETASGIFTGSPAREKRLDDYIAKTLDSYIDSLNVCREQTDGEPRLIVRASAGDIREIGGYLPPNPFGFPMGDADALAMPHLSPANLEKLERINDILKIKNEQDLPTLDDALKTRGISRAQFIAICREEARARPPANMPSLLKRVFG